MKPLSSHLVGTTTNLDRPKDLRDAAEKLEAVMVKKLLETSGAFEIKGTGGGTHSDLFTHAVSQAIARGGGFGLAEALMRDVGDESAKNSTPGAMRPTGLPIYKGAVPTTPPSSMLPKICWCRKPPEFQVILDIACTPFTGTYAITMALILQLQKGVPSRPQRLGWWLRWKTTKAATATFWFSTMEMARARYMRTPKQLT